MTPAHAVRTRLAKKTIQNFADQVGMVYFGYADQHGDDHRLVRGHTVSYTHVDNHVCVGSVRGYDATMLIRNDVVQLQPPAIGKKPKQQRCHWLITTVDLHTKRTVPHIYIGLRQHDEVYKSSYSRLRPLEIGNLAAYTPQFLGKYTIYGKMTHALEIERLISPQIASVITYTLISILPLSIIIILVGSGHNISNLQRWREKHKRFLQFVSGGSLLILGAFIFVDRVIGVISYGGNLW